MLRKSLQQFFNFQITQFLQNIQLMLRMRQRLQMHEEDDEVRDKRLKQSNKKPQTKQQEWGNLFKNNNSNKLKNHIMNFFLIEGHVDIAKQFAQQASINQKQIPQIDQQAIMKRYDVVKLIKQGQIDEALQKIKTLQNGKMFDEQAQKTQTVSQQNTEILFCLKSLKVINLIKEKKLQKAIIQARKQLLPYTKQDMKYMPRIEQIMSLLVYSNMKQCTSYYLTTSQYRSKIAKQVNTLLLSSQSQAIHLTKTLNSNLSYDSISQLLKLTKWVEERLQSHLQFPKINLKSLQSDRMFLPSTSK